MKNLSKTILVILSLIATVYFLYLHLIKNKKVKSVKSTTANTSILISKPIAKSVVKTVKKATKQIKPKLVKQAVKSLKNSREGLIWQKIKSKPFVTLPELLNLGLPVTDRTLRRDMNKLELQGFVKQEGTTKNSRYLILK